MKDDYNRRFWLQACKYNMVVRVIEFPRKGYKINKISNLKIDIPKENN